MTLDVHECLVAPAGFQLVTFRQQDMASDTGFGGPVHHSLVKLPEWMSDIHDHNNPHQAVAMAKILINKAVPFFTHLFRDLRVTEAREVNEPNVRCHLKEIDELRPPGCLAGSCEFALTCDVVDGRALPCVGASTERKF